MEYRFSIERGINLAFISTSIFQSIVFRVNPIIIITTAVVIIIVRIDSIIDMITRDIVNYGCNSLVAAVAGQ